MAHVKLTILNGGFCFHPERITLARGRCCSVAFPDLFFLIEHPQEGAFLFDTGYSARFNEATQTFPEKLYRWITPVNIQETETALYQLERLGLKPQDIRGIFISHFHADHIAALKDFPNAHYYCLQSAWDNAQKLGRWKGLLKAHLPSLLPDNFAQQQQSVEAVAKNITTQHLLAPWFATGYDLFNDGTIIAIHLPGHAYGQMGLLLQAEQGTVLLAADSAWTSLSFEQLRPPSKLSGLITASWRQTQQTLKDLHDIHNSLDTLTIIPSHCGRVFQEHVLQNTPSSHRLAGYEAS